MSDITVARLTTGEARDLTDEVKADAAALWAKLLTLYEGEAHLALGYSSWAAYCAAEFDFGRSSSYRLLDSARVITALEAQSPMGEGPSSERVARELVPALRESSEAAAEAWEQAVQEHGPQPTARQVREIVDQRAPEAPVTKRDQMRANAHKRRIVETVSYLRGLATGLGTLDVPRAMTAMEPGEAAEWAKELDRAISRLRDLRRDLETNA